MIVKVRYIHQYEIANFVHRHNYNTIVYFLLVSYNLINFSWIPLSSSD